MERINKTFDRCPVCGSQERLLETLAEDAKARHVAGEKFRMFYDLRQGAVVDQKHAVILPIGAKAATYHIVTDICLECGTVYAVAIGTGESPITVIDEPKPRPRLPRIQGG